MNRESLRVAAEAEGIRSITYCLDGGMPEETYVLTIREGGWAVYFVERGQRVSEERFDTEDEACDELFLRLVRDPTTRRR